MKTSIFRSSAVVAGSALTGLVFAFASPAHAQTKAALTRDIDRPSSQPVHGFCAAYLSSGAAKCTLLTVPAGKRLVVETVSYLTVSEIGKLVYQTVVGDGTRFNAFTNVLFSDNVFLLPSTLSYSTSSVNVYSGTQAVKFYVDEGGILVGGVNSTGVVGYEQQFSFSGFLVDK